MEADTGNNSVSFVVLGNCLVCAAEINLCADKVKVNIFVQLILVGKKDNIIFCCGCPWPRCANMTMRFETARFHTSNQHPKPVLRGNCQTNPAGEDSGFAV